VTVHYIDGGNSWSYPGLGIYVNKNEQDLTGYIQHEYRHYLQYLAYGSSLSWYDNNVAIPSAWSILRGDDNYTHDRQSYKLEATTLAHDFYGSNSVLNNYTFSTNYNTPRALDYPESSTPPEYENIENGFGSGFHP